MTTLDKVPEGINTKNLKDFKPMQRHWFLVSYGKKCPTCEKKKKLALFYNNKTIKVRQECNACTKKTERELHEREILKIVLEAMIDSGENINKCSDIIEQSLRDNK
jgi:Zn ribbon nucleic-acid-binding protein